MMELQIWQTLAEPRNEELVRLAGETNAADVAGVARLRKVCGDVEVVRAALMLAEARRKGVAKFGAARAAGLWADPQGVEMASSIGAARHKAARMAGMAGEEGEVLDLCCGIGGDAVGFVEAGLGVVAVDADPVRAWMAGRNAGVEAVCADVGAYERAAAVAHIDPARRSESGVRSWGLADMRPGPEVVARIIAQHGGVAIKLGPGIDPEDLPREWGARGMEIEYISENGRLTQAVVWLGTLAEDRGGALRATMLRDGEHVFSAADNAGIEAPVGGLRAYLAEADDSMERARQLGGLCVLVGGNLLHSRIGLITSDQVLKSSALTWFEVLAEMPWHEGRVKAALDERGAGIVEVKTRGKAVDTDRVQAMMRGRGEAALVLFVLRTDRRVRAIIARRAVLRSNGEP